MLFEESIVACFVVFIRKMLLVCERLFVWKIVCTLHVLCLFVVCLLEGLVVLLAQCCLNTLLFVLFCFVFKGVVTSCCVRLEVFCCC